MLAQQRKFEEKKPYTHWHEPTKAMRSENLIEYSIKMRVEYRIPRK